MTLQREWIMMQATRLMAELEPGDQVVGLDLMVIGADRQCRVYSVTSCDHTGHDPVIERAIVPDPLAAAKAMASEMIDVTPERKL